MKAYNSDWKRKLEMKWKLGLYKGEFGLGFPKMRVLRVPHKRLVRFCNPYWGPLSLGNLPHEQPEGRGGGLPETNGGSVIEMRLGV